MRGMAAGRASRVAVLWEHLTGYTQALLRALADGEQVQLLVVQRSREEHARFAAALPGSATLIDLATPGQRDAGWMQQVLDFSPEVALVTGNRDPAYRRVAAGLRQRGTVVVWASDVPARAWWRDVPAAITGRLRLRAFDAALVPGEQAARFARRVGFPPRSVFKGLYACDTALYLPVGRSRHASTTDWPRRFLYVGQYIRRKRLDTLIEAYRLYRRGTNDPWELWCAGRGPEGHWLRGEPGVSDLGFLAPEECASVMAQAGAFVLPSDIDHWGVVLHEAACAGLPLLATATCYGTIELVQEGVNGFTFVRGDAAGLARQLARCSDVEVARAMGRASLPMAEAINPQATARLLTRTIPESALRERGHARR